jgi:DNA-binding MarR family transcriptional regulator
MSRRRGGALKFLMAEWALPFPMSSGMLYGGQAMPPTRKATTMPSSDPRLSTRPRPAGVKHRRKTVASLLRDTHRLYAKALQALMGDTEISPNQWLLLRALWDEDGLTQKELSQRLGSFESAVVSSIDNLEAHGYVERIRNKDDRRKINVSLTRAGKALEAKLLPFAKQVNVAAEVGVTETQIRSMCETLERLHANLEAFLASRR